ncbi:hypothetical protein F4561_005600 [Lipingzhangella halophila]|uniref:Uncharacterized protein n=1 Tax=Lipingzhangella halophila TaxID=1783352 RepID=A0A7W7RCQ2_9ACTN|nr:hypothetical protein [Lipingzhangella halophila]MBB4929198.1 hypothetical protein [Lipingzhangella halophila]MBB4934706.1 hypothetical protein [Lipingzhangella halophila]
MTENAPILPAIDEAGDRFRDMAIAGGGDPFFETDPREHPSAVTTPAVLQNRAIETFASDDRRADGDAMPGDVPSNG